MDELLQNIIDGLGRGSIYALLALGVAVVFGIMHLLNFAHGELITIPGYLTYWAFNNGCAFEVHLPSPFCSRRSACTSSLLPGSCCTSVER